MRSLECLERRTTRVVLGLRREGAYVRVGDRDAGASNASRCLEEKMKSTTCPLCGRSGAHEKSPAEYAYKECGLLGVRLSGGVVETSCTKCGEKSVRILKEGQLLQLIALALLTTSRKLSGPELRFLRRSCQLSQASLAGHLKKRRETVAEREAKSDPKLSEAEETWFRLIVLREFNEVLGRPGVNLLSAVHRKRLELFMRPPACTCGSSVSS